MEKEIGFKKWSRGWTCGLPMDNPHALFLGLLKSVPGLGELGQKSSMCCVLDLLKLIAWYVWK